MILQYSELILSTAKPTEPKNEIKPRKVPKDCSENSILRMWKHFWLNKQFFHKMLKVDATMMEEALSCCQHMEGGCPSMAGDCDNDMECQPGA